MADENGPQKSCKACGSTDLHPYTSKPPRHHNGPCTAECWKTGLLCRACRLFQ